MLSISKWTVLVVILAVVGLVGSSVAQTGVARTTPAPQRIVKAQTGNGSVLPNGLQPSIGWYYVHPQNCTFGIIGATEYFYLYPAEGGYFYTNNHTYEQLLAPICQTGNFVAIYVYDSAGDWDQIYTFTFK
jgi:DNA-binding transcriptional regulator YdaS (Cro superfamily)